MNKKFYKDYLDEYAKDAWEKGLRIISISGNFKEKFFINDSMWEKIKITKSKKFKIVIGD